MDLDSQKTPWKSEQRRIQRVPFTATAEVIDIVSSTQFLLRTTDIGTGGCFLDALSPLPIWSRVRVIIHHGRADFQADGRVVYSQPRLGMGIAFDELDPEQRLSLLRLIEQTIA
jgi:hypothetical protein